MSKISKTSESVKKTMKKAAKKVSKVANKASSAKKTSDKKVSGKTSKKTTSVAKRKTTEKKTAKKVNNSKTNRSTDAKKGKKSNSNEKRNHKTDIDDTNIDDDEMIDEKPISFDFKGKEKDLVKKLKEEDEVLTDYDDEDEKNPDGSDSDEIRALNELDDDGPFKCDLEAIEREENRDKKQVVDIYDGVSLEDPVRMYLKEIGQYSLLTLEREQRLAKEKQDAQNILRKKDFPKKMKIDEEDAIKLPVDTARAIKLTPEELKIVKRGERAQQTLIECNLRLVVSIAKRYIGHGLSLLDLIQEGNLGLTRGIEKFNYKMGFKLSTYVTWWIRQAVSRALADQSKTIRIPVHMVETINRLNKEKKRLTTELGYEPSIKQLAKGLKMPEEKVEEVIQIAMEPISLDKPVGDEDDSIVADFIPDQNVLSPEAHAERVMLKEKIAGLLSKLRERERRVLILRFGIEDDHPRTLEEVGRELNVTRERIRQIEEKALRRMKVKAAPLKDLVK